VSCKRIERYSNYQCFDEIILNKKYQFATVLIKQAITNPTKHSTPFINGITFRQFTKKSGIFVAGESPFHNLAPEISTIISKNQI